MTLLSRKYGASNGTIAAMLLACALGVSTSARAQNRNTNDHWAAIERIAKSIGGLTNATKANDQLIAQLVARGDAYLDLYEMHRSVLRDFVMMRDSIAKSGGPVFVSANYFLGRALQEMNDVAGALAAYQRVPAGAPDKVKRLAAAWAGSLKAGGPRGWQSDIIDWRLGKPVRKTDCAEAVPACLLFQAILSDDVASIARVSKDMSERPVPDASETRALAAGSLRIDFFDPLAFYMLGVADFTIAAKLSASQRDGDLYRGLALLRANRPKDAESALKGARTTGVH